jgi:hypothetical protein
LNVLVDVLGMGYAVKWEDDFRAKAKECDGLANEAKDSEAKRILCEAAKNWRFMADQAERLGWGEMPHLGTDPF